MKRNHWDEKARKGKTMEKQSEDIEICNISFKITGTGTINIGFQAAEALDNESLLDLLRMAENKVLTAIFAKRFNEKATQIQQEVGPDALAGGENKETNAP